MSLVRSYCKRLVACVLYGVATTVSAFSDDTANDFGGVGLLQTPTARVSADGEFRAGVSSVRPYDQIFAGIQVLPWFEAELRYLRVTNRLYGPREFSGGQSYKDRGVDFKILLAPESEYMPAIALGVMDVGGTGLFASEYLVATRRLYDIDLSLGVGWGRLGTRGGIRNPFGSLSDKFKERQAAEIGGVGSNRFFRGEEIALFGGLQWQTPLPGFSLKLEYDGNDYKSEAADNNQIIHFPVNAALNWRVWDALDISAGVERGDTAMLRVSAFTNFNRKRGPAKVLDPKRTSPRRSAESDASSSTPTEVPEASLDPKLVDQIRVELERQQISLVAMDGDSDRRLLTVWFNQNYARDPHRAIGRIGQTLAILAPHQYETFTLVNVRGREETYRVTLMRREMLRALAFRGSAEEIKATSLIDPPKPESYAQAEQQFSPRYPSFDWGMGPALRQHIGGPDDFYFGQIWWRSTADLQLSSGWSINATAGINIYNNFDGLNARDTSALPPVRSDIVRYLKEGENNLVKLETNYVWSPAPSWWARFSAGIFEEMYGGVAGEVLYRPPYASWALGLDVNRVRQRDFDQRFAFRDYEVTTGHLTGYFDLPFYDMQMVVSAGRYLAGDRGGTFQLSRTFESGAKVGAFATKTNVSAADFGEGRFDKGFFLYLPMDLFFPRSTRRGSSLVFKPLTRDGGQKVRDGIGLYDLTQSGRLDPDASWIDVMR